MKRLLICSIIFFTLSNIPQAAFCQTEKVFRTKYTTVHYAADKEINDFIWRLGGNKFEFREDVGLASNRIDRIVERVKTILGMWIKTINIPIYLHRGNLDKNEVAFYDNNTGAIHISVENASDGALAHELAHAIINKYFTSPPSSNVQEILTQYVDKYLWSDY